MYTPLPPDDDQPFLVSTGHLAAPPQVEALVKAAYQRYKGLDEGKVADYIPALGEGTARTVRHLHRRRRWPLIRDRRFQARILHPERIQAVRLCAHQRSDRDGGGARKGRRQRHGPALQLRDGHRAQCRSHHESDGECGRDRDHESRARGYRGRQVAFHPRGAVALRRPRAGDGRRDLRVRGGDQPAQPRHRQAAGRLRAHVFRLAAGDRRLYQAMLAARQRDRPRGDGRDARRWRGQSAHQGACRQRRSRQAPAGGDGDGRIVRALGRLAVRSRPARQERRRRRHRDDFARQGRTRACFRRRSTRPATACARSASRSTCPSTSA